MTTAMQVLEAIGIGVEGISDENAEEINELLVPKRVKREKMNFVLGDVDHKDIKLPKQAHIVASVLNAEPMSITQWADAAEEEGLETKQSAERIVAYYRKNLVESGVCKEVSAG